MSQRVIENPVINTPYDAPTRRFRFDDDGITDVIEEGRRRSAYFVPIAQPRNKPSQSALFDTEWTQDRVQENPLVNDIRARVDAWRRSDYPGVTVVTNHLLRYWANPDREKPLFFCQREAVETLIYLTEVARRDGQGWMLDRLHLANEEANGGLPRLACKMATGTGKTVVMAMVIVWHSLNKRRMPQDSRFTDAFLIVTPGITIKDRLRVLLPNDPENYYRVRDVVPASAMEALSQSKIIITNYHAFQLRDTVAAGKLTKSILSGGDPTAFLETPDQMVRRVLRPLGNKRHIVVLNDEAHHCYRRKTTSDAERLKGEDRVEAETREEEARIWITGVEAVRAKVGIKAVYDVSATPFFLKGSGYPEGTLFPWVVSDFSLIDAIESGLVKVPRVPVEDNTLTSDLPTYRDLWRHVREHLPTKGRKSDPVGEEPRPPKELQGALHSLYSNYEQYYSAWQRDSSVDREGMIPPVFIVVCNNTNVSRLVYNYIAGWEKTVAGQTVVQAGQLPLFRNDDEQGGWLARPNTILVDSQQLESGSAMPDEFKRLAAGEIARFKAEYQLRFPSRDADDLTDEDLLREVMNTVGKPGKLGAQVKCVVSVSMLTEGWDANTVTHVLGVRAFGTQLLCEQVVGRALRRRSYVVDGAGRFAAEYAEVYGVPFSFIPCSGSTLVPKPGPTYTRVRALEERAALEIQFPRVAGYRFVLPPERLSAAFTDASRMALSTRVLPTEVVNAPIIGETSVHTLDDLRRQRLQTVAFHLAKFLLDRYFREDGNQERPWLFPQVLAIVQEWLETRVECHDHTFPQLLLVQELAHEAVDLIYRAIVAGTGEGPPSVKPILEPYDIIGSTGIVDFDTGRPVYTTSPTKCHVSHVVADTASWEQRVAQALEHMPEVQRYVKNDHLGFAIPYTVEGDERRYLPDFIACIDDGHDDDLLHVVVEVSGQKRKDKAAKVATMTSLWIPAVNSHGGFGRWAFVETTDPWNTEQTIRQHIARLPGEPPKEAIHG